VSRKHSAVNAQTQRVIPWSLINKVTSLMFIASLILWGYVEMTDADRFPIEHVKITGNYPHIHHKKIENALVPLVQNGFFNLPMAQLQQTLEQFPWIAHVELKRQWPDTLIVNIFEHQAYCLWNDTTVIATDNRLFKPPEPTLLKHLPKLYGPNGTEQIVLSMFEQLEEQLKPLQISVASLTLDNYYTWRMQLTNNLIVNLGREDVVARVGRFAKAYPKVFANQSADAAEYIDMRYQHGMAVKWRKQHKV